MQHTDRETIIAQTKKWVSDVVIGCNFCPFAAREVKRESIFYEVLEDATLETAMQGIAAAFEKLNNQPDIETSLLLFSNSFETFSEFLELTDLAEALVAEENYEGIYQVASFHPEYLFAGTTNKDASNYTNRSPYPMLHFLREDSVSKAVDSHPDIDSVPEINIAFTEEKGLLYMQQLLAACMKEGDK